jgi:hypothetical protein
MSSHVVVDMRCGYELKKPIYRDFFRFLESAFRYNDFLDRDFLCKSSAYFYLQTFIIALLKCKVKNYFMKITNEKTGENFSEEEIRRSTRIQKSATPKGDLSWYIKWTSSLFTLSAVTIRSSAIPELIWLDMLLSWFGCVGWFVVGFLWKDRAILLLNGVLSILLFSGLLSYYYS